MNTEQIESIKKDLKSVLDLKLRLKNAQDKTSRDFNNCIISWFQFNDSDNLLLNIESFNDEDTGFLLTFDEAHTLYKFLHQTFGDQEFIQELLHQTFGEQELTQELITNPDLNMRR